MPHIAKTLSAAIGILLAVQAAPGLASIAPGQVDDFEAGGLLSWQAGNVNPNPPANIATGGPAGANDNYLRLTSNGSSFAGGKLVVFNSNQWAGNYLGAAVGSIQMQVSNFGATSLVLRLILDDALAGQTLTTQTAVSVPAGSGWNTITFSLDSANLTGGVFNTVMSNVTTLDLVHSPTVISARSLAPSIVAQLGIDNITAVPRVLALPTWNVDASGNWSVAGNWNVGVPNGAGARAIFGGIITAPRTITVDAPFTVGRIDFDNLNAYTIAGANTLTLDATVGDAQINVTRGSHTISAPITLADNTSIGVASASNLSITGSLSAASSRVTKTGPGGLTTNQLRASGLSINEGKVVISSSGVATSLLNTLSIAGTPAAPTAKLDLTNSALVLDYPVAGPNPVADTRQQIIAGRGGTGLGKPWNGLGISSSTAQADVAASPNSRSIGYAVNADLPLGALTTFRGQAVDPSSVLIRYTRTADANLDGVVNDDDVTVVGTFYAPGVFKPEWAKGDFDFNGFVDDDDVTLLGVFYNPSATPIPSPAAGDAGVAAGGGAVAAVPEPSSLAIASVALCGLVAARRFRRLAHD